MIVDIKKQVFELLCEIANKYGNGDLNYMLFTLRVINFCQRHNIILNIKKDKNGHKQFRSVKI